LSLTQNILTIFKKSSIKFKINLVHLIKKIIIIIIYIFYI